MLNSFTKTCRADDIALSQLWSCMWIAKETLLCEFWKPDCFLTVDYACASHAAVSSVEHILASVDIVYHLASNNNCASMCLSV